MPIQRPAVFLDRDGILNEPVTDPATGLPDSPRLPEELVLARHAGAMVRGLKDLGYACLVVTNQPGLAKGTLTPERLSRIHQKLEADLEACGTGVDGIYFCPHHPDPGPAGRAVYTRACTCRKPAPGLLIEAAAEHQIDLPRSFMVGDRLTDVEAGRRAGVTTILVGEPTTELRAEIEACPDGRPDRIARDLAAVVRIIASLREASFDGG